MIYLDNMGHLWSNESFQELYDFGVGKLGLNPEWNHYSRWFPHFDLTTKNMKNRAKLLGATLVDARDRDSFDSARRVFRDFHENYDGPEYWYECKGLYGQKILRVDFGVLLNQPQQGEEAAGDDQ